MSTKASMLSRLLNLKHKTIFILTFISPFLLNEPARCCARQHPDREEVTDQAQDNDPHGDDGDHGVPVACNLLVSDWTSVTVPRTQ